MKTDKVPVNWHDNEDKLNQAIKLPCLGNFLTLEDGRRLQLTAWEPRIRSGEFVEVTLTAQIFLPDDKIFNKEASNDD